MKAETERIMLHFEGPYTFGPGERSLFHCSVADRACVYLWTFRADHDQLYYVHYVGEASSFARRQRDHLVRVIGMDYGIFDPDAARRLVLSPVWGGLWRDRSQDGPGRALGAHKEHAATARRYIHSLDIFAAIAPEERELRKHLEGLVGRAIRAAGAEAKALYPDDNRVAARAVRGGVLQLSSDAPIAGLPPLLEM